MSDEQPVVIQPPKRARRDTSTSGEQHGLTCIVHFEHYRAEPVKRLTDHAFAVIRQAALVRQRQHDPKHRLDNICSNLPTVYIEDIHGRHDKCYKSFTNTSYLKQPAETSTPSTSTSSATALLTNETTIQTTIPKRPSRSTNVPSAILFSKDQCIFCNKGRKYYKGEYDELVKCVTSDAADTIQQYAKVRNDFQLLGKISGLDLVAREAHYHTSCRKNYTRAPNRIHHAPADDDDLIGGLPHRQVSAEAYEHVFKYVRNHIIDGRTVARINLLRDKYLDYIEAVAPQFSNDNYKTDKLKARLIAEFGQQIQFWKTASKSELVFRSDIEVGAALEIAYDSASSENNMLANVAKILRRKILLFAEGVKKDDTPWPPSSDYLLSGSQSSPQILTHFLEILITGKSNHSGKNPVTDRTSRLSTSIAEDICYAVSRGSCITSKHLLLGVSVHHLTGSAQLVTMLNRFGHCCSYTKVLDVENAMAMQVKCRDEVLPYNISPANNIMANLCWDNFDLNEETPSGSGTTHSTHGILIQEIMPDVATTSSETCLPRKVKSTKYIPQPLPPCFSKRRAEPTTAISESLSATTTSSESTLQPVTMPSSILMPSTSTESTLQPLAADSMSVSEMCWIICRAFHNNKYTIPDWRGWVSATSDNADLHKSVIGYMAPILFSITEYSTVQQCLITSMEASAKLNQKYTFVTMDLAAAKIAFDIKWSSPQRFQNVFIHLGPFHIMCSYMGCVGKMMIGSGWEELILDADICSSGSLSKVISGKHYNRALRVHVTMLDALERLLLKVFLQHNPDIAVPVFADTSSFPDILKQFAGSETTFLERYNEFKQKVREGYLGITAQVWMAYIDSVWCLLRFHKSIKENDICLYIQSIHSMCGLFFSADHLHYARYLPLYYHQLQILKLSQPEQFTLLKSNGFTVQRSTIPGNRCAIDLTIEQTINRSAKCAGGIIGFSRRPSTYYKWCVTRHSRASYLQATLDRVDMLSDCESSHKSVKPSQLKRSEGDVQKLLKAFDEFQNPFSITSDLNKTLINLSSGQPAPPSVVHDMTRFRSAGNTKASEFIADRIEKKTLKFQDPMKKMSLKTFQSTAVVKVLTTTQKKSIQIKADRDLLARLLLLSQKNDISLTKIFQYQLGPIPWCLATADGSMVKTNKAQLMHHLEKSVSPSTDPPPEDVISVVDGNAVIQSCVGLPDTFGELAVHIFRILPKSQEVHFVTDSYHENSIKSFERFRRGSSSQYSIGGPKTKLPRDFKSFLSNSQNKTQLIDFLKRRWTLDEFAARLRGRKIFFVCEKECVSLTSEDGLTTQCTPVQCLFSSQEEADTRIILHCQFICNTSPGKIIVVRSPDTDVLVLLVAYCTTLSGTLMFDTGVGNNRRLIPVNEIVCNLGPQMCNCLIALHAFTGCDFTSSFLRRGKTRPLSLVQHNTDFQALFTAVGNTALLSTDISHQLETFVCAMYGRPSYSNVNQLRHDLFVTRCQPKSNEKAFVIDGGLDLSLLPPCRSSLALHSQRANYVACIWKQAHVPNPDIPPPNGFGWKVDDCGQLVVEWSQPENIMPQDLIDVIASDSSAVDDNIIEEDDEIDNIVDVIFDDDDDD